MGPLPWSQFDIRTHHGIEAWLGWCDWYTAIGDPRRGSIYHDVDIDTSIIL